MIGAPVNRQDAPDYGRRNREIILAGYLRTARRQLEDPETTLQHGRAVACWLIDNGTAADAKKAHDWLRRRARRD